MLFHLSFYCECLVFPSDALYDLRCQDELVFEQGERGTQFFLLVEGEVSVLWLKTLDVKRAGTSKIQQPEVTEDILDVLQ